jgi:chromosome partitioning protein
MTVWSIANQKGGVGKTTTAVSIGGYLAQWGERTLLVDLDPHGSLSAYFGLDPDTLEPSAYRLFAPPVLPLPSLVRPTGIPGLDLVPASTALATLERQTGREGLGLTLRAALGGAGEAYSRIVIDCPPVFGILMLNALAAADTVIVPVQTEFLAERGLQRMRRTLAMVARSLPGGGPRSVIVPTLHDQRTRAAQLALAGLQRLKHEGLWAGVVPADTRLRDASRAGVPIGGFDPGSRGGAAYRVLTRYLLGLADAKRARHGEAGAKVA